MEYINYIEQHEQGVSFLPERIKMFMFCGYKTSG